MKVPDIKITLNDLRVGPYGFYYDAITRRCGDRGEFNPVELINKIGDDNIVRANDLMWFIAFCKKCRRIDVIKYFLSLSPSTDSVWAAIKIIIKDVDDKIARALINYYKADNKNDPLDVLGLLIVLPPRVIEKYKMLEYFMSLNPGIGLVRRLLAECYACRTKEIAKYFLSLNPSDDDLSLLYSACHVELTCNDSYLKFLIKQAKEEIKDETEMSK